MITDRCVCYYESEPPCPYCKYTHESLIAWLERRLEYADYLSLPIYVKQFEQMWVEEYGNLDGIPQELKDRTMEKYKRMKGGVFDDQRK